VVRKGYNVQNQINRTNICCAVLGNGKDQFSIQFSKEFILVFRPFTVQRLQRARQSFIFKIFAFCTQTQTHTQTQCIFVFVLFPRYVSIISLNITALLRDVGCVLSEVGNNIFYSYIIIFRGYLIFYCECNLYEAILKHARLSSSYIKIRRNM